MRSGYRTVVAWPRRGEGERAAYNLGRLTAGWAEGESRTRPSRACASPRRRCATASSRPGLKLAVIPEHRLLRRRRAAPRRPDRGRRRRGALRSFADLRTGDIVVHEDHGLARFAGFDTKTVAGVTRDYLDLEYAGHGPGLHAGRPAREDLALRRRRRRAPAAVASSAARAGRR